MLIGQKSKVSLGLQVFPRGITLACFQHKRKDEVVRMGLLKLVTYGKIKCIISFKNLGVTPSKPVSLDLMEKMPLEHLTEKH